MPSSSKKQHNFMAAVANNPAFAKKVGVSKSVGEDFTSADKGKKFGTGGTIGQINKQQTRHGAIFGSKKAAPDVNLNKYAGLKKGGDVMAKESKARESPRASDRSPVRTAGTREIERPKSLQRDQPGANPQARRRWAPLPCRTGAQELRGPEAPPHGLVDARDPDRSTRLWANQGRLKPRSTVASRSGPKPMPSNGM
jgi:hypothetical protein